MLHLKIHRGVMKVRPIFKGPAFTYIYICPVRPRGPGTMLGGDSAPTWMADFQEIPVSS